MKTTGTAKIGAIMALGGTWLCPGVVMAAEAAAPAIDSGDTAWMLASTALVMLMTPGLALFYGGLVRKKNVLSTVMHSLTALGVISIQWALFGYSLSFGPDIGSAIGGLSMAGLVGVGGQAQGTIPAALFMMFQMMFAIITAALISGAVAERMKFSAFVVFILLWTTLVYDPLAHWVWGGGWIMKLGALDFAGGLVVHISSGMAALAAALVLGPRLGYPREQIMPHNLPLTLLGAALLWFGWFGFNAGSALASGSLAATSFMATHIAASAGALGWAAVEWRHRGKPTALGAASGMVAGLVAITPAAGFVTPMPSILIGLGAGVLCYLAVMVKGRLGYDDSLDAFGIHGVGGIWGALATGLFATVAVNSAGADGLFYGGAGLLLKQMLSVAVVALYAFAVTFGILKAIDAVMGLRVDKEEETMGLDLAQHGESGYNM